MDRYNTGDMNVTYRRFIFLRRSFPSFCGRRNLVSHLVLPQKFTASALIRFARSAHSENAHGAFLRCARPKVRFWTAGSHTLLGRHFKEISRENEQVTSRLDQGWSAAGSLYILPFDTVRLLNTFVTAKYIASEAAEHACANLRFCEDVCRVKYRSLISAQKFHVRSGTAHFRLSLIAVPRRTSHLSPSFKYAVMSSYLPFTVSSAWICGASAHSK